MLCKKCDKEIEDPKTSAEIAPGDYRQRSGNVVQTELVHVHVECEHCGCEYYYHFPVNRLEEV